MTYRRSHVFVLSLLLSFSWHSCKDDSGKEGIECTKDYNQTVLLSNFADSLIVPCYTQLNQQVNEFETNFNDWKTNQDPLKLNELRSNFENLYQTWLFCAYFGFGPAEELFLAEAMNNFPLNTSIFLDQLKSGDFANNPTERYDRGLPAWDYVLFGTGLSDQKLTDSFSNSATILQYLEAMTSDMATRTQAVVDKWVDFKRSFKANHGTNAGSSLSLIINYWNKNYETNKRDRLGIPSGVLTLGIPNPTKVEALNSGLSKKLLKSSLEFAHQIFNGNSFLGLKNGEGIDDLLNYIQAQSNGQPFAGVIDQQFNNTLEKLNLIPEGDMQDAVNQNNEKVIELYAQTSQQLILTKTDLPSVLCISITYIDNPSDSD